MSLFCKKQGTMVLWLFLKLFLLYTISFGFSVSIYFYLNGKLLPPHRTIKFPLNWREEEGIGVVELGKGQRLGGNFYLKQNYDGGDSFEIIYSNVPYDISLLLKYPDRPEISDLGNLRISMKLTRKDGTEAVKIETLKALRYESKILRFFKEILSLPSAIWRDSGSERIERISLVERLIDDEFAKKEEREKDFLGLNEKKDENKRNPIDRIEIKIKPLPPLHSLQLEILANLSPLQHFLFYYRIPSAIFIIGVSTTILWLLVTFYGLIEVLKIVLNLRKGKEVICLDEITEFEQVMKSVESAESADTVAVAVADDENNQDTGEDISSTSVQFPEADSVANFIGDLRQRKLKTKAEDDDDLISVYNSDAEDQSVPSDFKEE